MGNRIFQSESVTERNFVSGQRIVLVGFQALQTARCFSPFHRWLVCRFRIPLEADTLSKRQSMMKNVFGVEEDILFASSFPPTNAAVENASEAAPVDVMTVTAWRLWHGRPVLGSMICGVFGPRSEFPLVETKQSRSARVSEMACEPSGDRRPMVKCLRPGGGVAEQQMLPPKFSR